MLNLGREWPKTQEPGLISSPTFKGNKTLFLGWPNSGASQRTLLVWEGCQRSHSCQVGKTMFEPLTTQSNTPSGKDHTFTQDLVTHHREILHTKGEHPQAKFEPFSHCTKIPALFWIDTGLFYTSWQFVLGWKALPITWEISGSPHWQYDGCPAKSPDDVMGPACHVLLLSQDSRSADLALTGRELIFLFLVKEIKWVAARSLIEVHTWSMSCLGNPINWGLYIHLQLV